MCSETAMNKYKTKYTWTCRKNETLFLNRTYFDNMAI